MDGLLCRSTFNNESSDCSWRGNREAWNEIPSEKLYTATAKTDSDGIGSLRLVRVQPIPEEIPLLLGEMLYQLRSALDSCIYQAAVYSTKQDPPPDEQKLEFPISVDRAEFPGLQKRRLSALPMDVQEGIEKIQPYHAPVFPPEEVVKKHQSLLGITP